MPRNFAVAIPIGDPNGVGPEVICKTLASVTPRAEIQPILIGSQKAIEAANHISQTKLNFTQFTPEKKDLLTGTIAVIDDESLSAEDFTVGQANAAAGTAQVRWLTRADAMCRKGDAQALIMGPINTEAVELANAWSEVERIAEPTPNHSYLLVITGPLRVVHLIHHRPVIEVCHLIQKDTILHALTLTHRAFEDWGAGTPRIGIAGWNPHAYGEEERTQIIPAIKEASARGFTVSGPISPDTIFRHAIEGKYDVILAMSHDQGHIAIKTWGFKGNYSVTLGVPYISTSVAHGTAYDIAGKGVADETNFRESYLATIRLLLGEGLSA